MKKYKRIALFVGHSKLVNGSFTGAMGFKNEYLVNKELAFETKKWLDVAQQPCDVIVVPEGTLTNKNQESKYKLPIANSGKYDLIVEFHNNAFKGTASGTEVLYKSNDGKEVATRVNNKLDDIFDDRGVRFRDDLYMLTKTKPVSVMLEVFFVDNKKDCDTYDRVGAKAIAKKIAEGLIDSNINEIVKKPEVTKPTEFNTNREYEVIANILNVRDNRGTKGKIVGQLKKGQKISIWSIEKAEDGSDWGSFSPNCRIFGY